MGGGGGFFYLWDENIIGMYFFCKGCVCVDRCIGEFEFIGVEKVY